MHHLLARAALVLLAVSGTLAACTQGEVSTYEYTNPLTGAKMLVKGQAQAGWELYSFEEGPEALRVFRRPGVVQVVAQQSGTRVLMQSENDQGISIYLSDTDADGIFDQLDYSVGPDAHVFDYKADGRPDVMTIGGATSIRIGDTWYPYVPADQDGRRFAIVETQRRAVELHDGNWEIIE